MSHERCQTTQDRSSRPVNHRLPLVPLRSLTRKPTDISSSTTSSSEIVRRPTIFPARTTKTPILRSRKPTVKLVELPQTTTFTPPPFTRRPGLEKLDCTSNPNFVKCKLFGPSKFGLVRENDSRSRTTSPKPTDIEDVTKKPTGLVKFNQFLTSLSPLRRPLKPRKKGKDLSNEIIPDTDHGPAETPLAPLTPLTPEQGPVTMCGVGAADCHPDHHLIPHTIKTISPTDDCATHSSANNTACLVSVTQCPEGRIGPDCQLGVKDNKETLDKEDDNGDNEHKCLNEECVTCDRHTGECLTIKKPSDPDLECGDDAECHTRSLLQNKAKECKDEPSCLTGHKNISHSPLKNILTTQPSITNPEIEADDLGESPDCSVSPSSAGCRDIDNDLTRDADMVTVTPITSPDTTVDTCQHNCPGQTTQQQNRKSKTITNRPTIKKPFTAFKTRRPRPLSNKIPSQNRQQNKVSKQEDKKFGPTTEAIDNDDLKEDEETQERGGKKLDDSNDEYEEPTPEPEPTHIGNPRYHAFHSWLYQKIDPKVRAERRKKFFGAG